MLLNDINQTIKSSDNLPANAWRHELTAAAMPAVRSLPVQSHERVLDAGHTLCDLVIGCFDDVLPSRETELFRLKALFGFLNDIEPSRAGDDRKVYEQVMLASRMANVITEFSEEGGENGALPAGLIERLKLAVRGIRDPFLYGRCAAVGLHVLSNSRLALDASLSCNEFICSVAERLLSDLTGLIDRPRDDVHQGGDFAAFSMSLLTYAASRHLSDSEIRKNSVIVSVADAMEKFFCERTSRDSKPSQFAFYLLGRTELEAIDGSFSIAQLRHEYLRIVDDYVAFEGKSSKVAHLRCAYIIVSGLRLDMLKHIPPWVWSCLTKRIDSAFMPGGKYEETAPKYEDDYLAMSYALTVWQLVENKDLEDALIEASRRMRGVGIATERQARKLIFPLAYAWRKRLHS